MIPVSTQDRDGLGRLRPDWSANIALVERSKKLVLGAILALFVCLSATRVESQEVLTMDQWKQGFHGFNILAQGNDFEVVDLDVWNRIPEDAKSMVVLGDLNRLPFDLESLADRGVSMLIASDQDSQVLNSMGVQISSWSPTPVFENDYYRLVDCPRIRPRLSRGIPWQHPLFDEVEYVIANQPGSLVSTQRRPKLLPIANHPRSGSGQVETTFGCVSSKWSGQSVICLADDSFLNNQMLSLGYNARFAQNIVLWLSQKGQRKKLLIMVDGVPMTPTDPMELAVLPPPPTRKEVLDALESVKDLPFWTMMGAMRDFGNLISKDVQESNMVNEFIHKTTDNISDRNLSRLLILISFVSILMTGLVAYIWQRKLLRKTASDVATKRQKMFSERKTLAGFQDRQLAASMILNAFCLDLSNRRLDDWPMFPQGLDVGNEPEAVAVINEISDFHQSFRSQGAKFWTTKRLMELESASIQWRRYFVQIGMLEHKT